MATQSGEDGVGANATVLLVSKSGWMDVVCLRFVRVFVYFYLKLGKGWEITAWAVEFARKIERFPGIQREGIGFFQYLSFLIFFGQFFNKRSSLGIIIVGQRSGSWKVLKC